MLELFNPDFQKIIIVPLHISREYIQGHRQWNFVYSADYLLRGTFGQMWSAHNEPNTFPVPVLHKSCANSVFFQDHLEQFAYVDEFLGRIPRDKPVICYPKIGQGHSRMKEFSPKLYEHLINELKKIEYKWKKIDYYL